MKPETDDKKSRLDAFKPNFTTFALTYFKDEKDGHWKIAKVQLDPVLKVAGKVDITESEPDRLSIIERFKIVAARDLDIG